MKRRAQGVTLAELVLAIGFLATISIIVAGVFTHLLNSSAKTTDLAAARMLATTVLDRAARSGGPPDFGFISLTGNTARLQTQDAGGRTEFFYNIVVDDLNGDDSLAPTIVRCLYSIEVEVSWTSSSARAERGMLSTKISQTVKYDL